MNTRRVRFAAALLSMSLALPMVWAEDSGKTIEGKFPGPLPAGVEVPLTLYLSEDYVMSIPGTLVGGEQKIAVADTEAGIGALEITQLKLLNDSTLNVTVTSQNGYVLQEKTTDAALDYELWVAGAMSSDPETKLSTELGDATAPQSVLSYTCEPTKMVPAVMARSMRVVIQKPTYGGIYEDTLTFTAWIDHPSEEG